MNPNLPQPLLGLAASAITIVLSLGLADNLRMGHCADHLHAGLHCHGHARHMVYYMVEEPGVFIVRVLHEATEAQRHIGTDKS
jgi:plasmid stabilization system protein ParE